MTWTPVHLPKLDLEQVGRRDARRPLVVVVGPDAAGVERVGRSLAAATTHIVPGEVTAGLCTLVVGWDLGTPELGPPALSSAESWLTCVRLLLLRLLPPGQGTTVLACPGPVWQLMYLRRLLPDASFVLDWSQGDDEEWDDRLPELRHEDDTLATEGCTVTPPRSPPVAVSTGRPTTGERSVVLVGSGRSGTTWLHNLVCASEHVAGTSLGETSVFGLLDRLWAALGAGSSSQAALRALRCFVREALVDALDPTGTRLVCEKTPQHSWHIPLIRHLLPEARFVHVIRDGRDVAMSLHALDAGYDGLAGAGRFWARLVHTVAAELDGDERAAVLTYERLLADPVTEVVALWSAWGLTASSADLAQLEGRIAVQVTPLPSRRAPGSERWRELPPTELAALDAAIGRALRRCGYLA